MPDVRSIDDLDRAELAVLGREYLMAGHLIDRAGMPHLVGSYGLEPMRDIAIDEWMGASPVYTRRTQRLLDFGGDDVATMFKGMQFDVGAPHQFLDFRYLVHDADEGEFWLDHCGALMDVEPMGDDFVHAMCHAIEDPTFEATVCATNPRARMEPIHRPPRTPADRHPHCHWKVHIERGVEDLLEPEQAILIAGSRAAAVPVARVADLRGADTGPGHDDYHRPLDPDLRMEDFSRAALLGIAEELCLQGHLLVLSFFAAIERRYGVDDARDVVAKQFVGVAGVTASRLRTAFGLGDDAVAIATVLELHPALRPRSYVDATVTLDDGVVGLELRPCPEADESVAGNWIDELAGGNAAALEAIVQAVDPRAGVEELDAPDGVRSWRVVIGDEAAREAREVTLTRFSTGADFVFRTV